MLNINARGLEKLRKEGKLDEIAALERKAVGRIVFGIVTMVIATVVANVLTKD